jgi:choline dehydrogenase-like flavoprotein
MLDVVLPQGQMRFGERLKVLPDATVTGIEHDGRGRAVAVHCEVAGERARIAADTVVVAAGAVASSGLLLRSGVGGARVGHDLFFNATSPLTADFERVMDAHASLQMSHAYEPEAEAGLVIETWFNPVATQALAMPGWFEEHYANMLRYRHMVCGGVLVGTTVPGRVKATRDGTEIDFTPAAHDLARVVDGLKLLGRLFLAAGARRVMPATYAWHEFGSAGALDALDDYVRDGSDLLLTSAHPQGGNALGAVVDERFRVRGFSNLHVCDASVFPSSVTVNPQLTVMALAQYAAPRILAAG